MLALYAERLATLQDRVVATLGSHMARVLLDRAILIHHGDGGLYCGALQMSDAPRLEEEIAIEAAFNDLFAEMRLILSGLLGPEMAERIWADDAEDSV
jgi:hypothetical protein